MTFTISKESLPFRADKSISQITLSNERLTIVVHDYGARVHQLLTPDKNGTFENNINIIKRRSYKNGLL
jgi:aldose 1-epimerase